MASLHDRPNGWQVRYGRRDRNGKDKRKSVNIGPMSESEADAASLHIEHLSECQQLGAPPKLITQKWLNALPLEIHARIADKGLCEYRFTEECRTVAGLCKHFLDWKQRDKADSSIVVYKHATRLLTHHFGGGKEITAIKPAEMDDFIRWIYAKGMLINGDYSAPLAATTASRRCQNIKSMFRRAWRQRWISADAYYEMFDSMPRQVRTNPARKHWVDAELVEKIVKHARDTEQRLIFALGRWAGIRMPSELLQLQWTDVDRDHEKLCVRSPKQRNHAHKRERWIPIWPEIRIYLDQQFDEIRDGATHIIDRYRSSNTSAHSTLLCQAAYRAGITKHRDQRPWPKLWINMRSTRATELRKQYPANVVDYWMNHSAKVSRDHYQQWDSFEWRE